MYRRTASTVACLLAGAGAVSAQNSTIECAEGLQMIISRGTGEDPGTGVAGLIARQIADRIDGSKVHAIDYPASYDDPIYFLSVANGTKTVGDTIKQYSEACPDTKLAVFGYSQGAQITSNSLCGEPHVWAAQSLMASGGSSKDIDVNSLGQPLPTKYTDNIVSTVLFGDPTHQADAPYNKGTAEGSGVFYRADYSACEDLGDRIRSYCDTGDVFCDVGDRANVTTHLVYVQKYGKEVVDFVVDQYENRPGPGSASSTSEPTPTPTNAAGSLGAALAVAVTAPLIALNMV